jgi:hypothetical protein
MYDCLILCVIWYVELSTLFKKIHRHIYHYELTLLSLFQLELFMYLSMRQVRKRKGKDSTTKAHVARKGLVRRPVLSYTDVRFLTTVCLLDTTPTPDPASQVWVIDN